MTKIRRSAIGGATAVLAGSALAATMFVTPAAAEVATPNLIEPTAGETQINLIGMNDFHGRIKEAPAYAATVLTAQQGFTEDNSLVLSNGDHVGASSFESNILDDQPTIDALNEMGVDSWTQGNHEFDKGAADAIDRIQPATDGPDLAANVIGPDGTKPFDEYATFTVDGLEVAIVGAVTQETPGLVTPGILDGYEFTEPVAAVNEVADRLSDGNPDNGEADVIVASYHEGGPSSNVSLDENLSNEVFAGLTNNTSANVDAIFNGHTHRTYAYDAPVPGTDRTRPVVQAGEFAENIAQVVLTVDAENNVTLAQSSIVPVLLDESVPPEVAGDPRITNINAITEQAISDAAEVGSVQIGQQDGDITRGLSASDEEDRANASALGDIVANSMLESVAAMGREVDLAVMNPGGLRADMIDDDGIITYKEAADVLTFANNLSTATVSGATLKTILEQQWQPAEASRPYLQLGLSDGFTYTSDATRPEGDRITSMYLGTTQIDPEATYNVVAPTFITEGGDNFSAFNEAMDRSDTGLIDLDAFVSWIESQDTVVPNQQRNGFEVQGYPAEPVTCGDSASFTVSNVDLSSAGAIANTELAATAYVVDDAGESSTVEVGRTAITDGSATFDITIPEDFRTDTFEIVVEAQPSGSYVILPIDVQCEDATVPPVDPTPTPTPTSSTDLPDPSTPPAEGDDDGHEAGQDDDLASTGADSNVLFGALAAALGALVIGGTLMVLRRRSAE